MEFNMECSRNRPSKGSISRDMVGGEPSSEMFHDKPVVISKIKQFSECLKNVSNSVGKKPKQEAQHVERKSKNTKSEKKRKLEEMLLLSDLILQKSMRLELQCRILLEKLNDDTLGAPM